MTAKQAGHAKRCTSGSNSWRGVSASKTWVEAGEDLRLPLEPGQPIRVSREGVGQDLQGDLAVELGVGRLPDLAHAALADEGGDVVMAESRAGRERHFVFSSTGATASWLDGLEERAKRVHDQRPA